MWNFETLNQYYAPFWMRNGSVSKLVFSDAGRITARGQLSIFTRFLFAAFSQDSVFYILTWMGHKFKRPVKLVGSAEILTLSEFIDEVNILRKFLRFHQIPIRVLIAVNSQYLF